MRCPLAILTLALTASLSFGQDAKLPEGLRHVPADALGFVHIRAGDFLKSEIGKQLVQEILKDKEASKGLQKIERELGMSLMEVESVTVLMLGMPSGPQFRFDRRPHIHKKVYEMNAPAAMPGFKIAPAKPAIEEEKDVPKAKESPVLLQEGPAWAEQIMPYIEAEDVYDYMSFSGPLFIVTSTKPLSRKKMLESQLFRRGPGSPYDRPGRDQTSMLFLSDRSVMFGMPWEVARYSDQMARNPGPKATPMKAALAMGMEPHTIVAGGHLPPELRRMVFSPFGLVGPDLRALVPLTPLLTTESALTLDLGKRLDLTLRFAAANEASAAMAMEATKTLKDIAELALEKSNEAAEPGGWKLVLQKRVKEALGKATIEQKGTTVQARVTMELDPVLVKHFTKEIVDSIRWRGDRTLSVNNLKQIALAMHSYHDANKRFPPAGLSDINNPNGKPLLSWRVAILPYIDEFDLYKQFDLTQPWDHPTNKKLIARMPAIYMVPGAPESKEPGMTHYRVLVGPQTMFEAGQRINFAQVTDGLSNTIMAVEASEPTVWTKPDDLPFNPNGPLPQFGISPDGFHAAFGDGTVRFLRAGTPENVLRALITRNGGEAVAIPEDR